MTLRQYLVVASRAHPHNPTAVILDEAQMRDHAEKAMAALALVNGLGVVLMQVPVSAQFMHAPDVTIPPEFTAQLNASVQAQNGPRMRVLASGNVNLKFQFPDNILIQVDLEFSPPLDATRYRLEAFMRVDPPAEEEQMQAAIAAATEEAARSPVRH